MLYLLGYLVLVGLVLRFFDVGARGDCDTDNDLASSVKYIDKTNYFGEDVR